MTLPSLILLWVTIAAASGMVAAIIIDIYNRIVPLYMTLPFLLMFLIVDVFLIWVLTIP